MDLTFEDRLRIWVLGHLSPDHSAAVLRARDELGADVAFGDRLPWSEYARPAVCTCGSIYGCYEHGPEPRERAVPCPRCRRATWTVSGVCPDCYVAFLYPKTQSQKG
jgi:hypothetical protein